jgi:hypothetical protein
MRLGSGSMLIVVRFVQRLNPSDHDTRDQVSYIISSKFAMQVACGEQQPGRHSAGLL